MLRVRRLEASSETKGKDILVRFKIMDKGSSGWVGVISGVRSLDCVERGGLGLIPAEHAHVMSAQGLFMAHLEGQTPENYGTDSVYG